MAAGAWSVCTVRSSAMRKNLLVDGIQCAESASSPGFKTRGCNGTKSAFADYAEPMVRDPTGSVAPTSQKPSQAAPVPSSRPLARYGRGLALSGAGRGRHGRRSAPNPALGTWHLALGTWHLALGTSVIPTPSHAARRG